MKPTISSRRTDDHAVAQSAEQRAQEVFGDKDKALRWMGTPVRALNYATPISLLGSKEGAKAVLDVLTRVEHGVY